MFFIASLTFSCTLHFNFFATNITASWYIISLYLIIIFFNPRNYHVEHSACRSRNYNYADMFVRGRWRVTDWSALNSLKNVDSNKWEHEEKAKDPEVFVKKRSRELPGSLNSSGPILIAPGGNFLSEYGRARELEAGIGPFHAPSCATITDRDKLYWSCACRLAGGPFENENPTGSKFLWKWIPRWLREFLVILPPALLKPSFLKPSFIHGSLSLSLCLSFLLLLFSSSLPEFL